MLVVRTPLRITLGGGGSDLPDYYRQFGGFVFGAAIDKFVSIRIHENRTSEQIEYHHDGEAEIVNHRDELNHAFTREAMRLSGIDSGVIIASISDAPPGTGLGSSGSFAVGMLNALYAFRGQILPTVELAEKACHLEADRLKKASGKQDQYLAAFGGITVLTIDKSGMVGVRKAKISPDAEVRLNENLQLYYTRFRRNADGILSRQSQALRRRNSQVVKCMHRIKEIGYAILEAVESGNLTDIGLLMDQHWRCKKMVLSTMSNSDLDFIYRVAKENGVIGGKIIGAGGGGFFLFYTEKNSDCLDQAMKKMGLTKMHYRFEWQGSRIFPGTNAGESGCGSMDSKGHGRKFDR